MENIKESWFVVLTEPQQEISTVWRLHEAGLELFAPVIRKRVKTGRTGKNGHKVTRIVPRPMFPGYGFIRTAGISDINGLIETRGIRDLLRIQGNPVMLPDVAIKAVFARQMEQQHVWLRQAGSGRRTSTFKRGDSVRVDEDGGAYAGLLATVDKVDGKGRIEVLFGMIRHTLPSEMVVAA